MPLYRQPIQQTILDALGTRVTDIENLITTLTTQNITLLSRIAALESATSHPGYRTGRYYQGIENALNDTPSTGGLSANGISYVPFFVHNSVSLNRLAIYCSNALSNANARIGIYSNVNGLPGNLLVDAGNLAVATVGAKEAIISLSLSKGWYWFSGITTLAPFLYCASTFLGNNHLLGQLAPSSLSTTCSLRNTGSYTSLPSTAPIDNLSLITGNFAPLFWFKVN